MKLQEGSPQPVSLHQRPISRVLLWVAVVLCLGLLGSLVITGLRAQEDRRLKWITPAELKRKTQAGPLTRWKWKALRVLGPLGRIFTASTRQILIEVKFITLPAGT